MLADLYGEGEIVVNSEHRQAVQRVANGFIVSGTALDGVTEAIESNDPDWFAMGVQWQPASASASGPGHPGLSRPGRSIADQANAPAAEAGDGGVILLKAGSVSDDASSPIRCLRFRL